MTESDMLHLEKENYTTIHLHLVGIFWRAYQRSACGFCKEKRPYKINIRSNKRQRTTVFFLGFPDSALQEILAADDYTRVDDSHITLPMEYLSDDEMTKVLQAHKDSIEAVSAVATPAQSGLFAGLPGHIMAFPLYNSSPLECMEFIARLQKQLGSDGSVR